MTKQGDSSESPLDAAAAKRLVEVIEDFRWRLVAKTSMRHGEVTPASLDATYEWLLEPSLGFREIQDAQAIVSQALRENRAIEWVSYAMSLVLFVFGLNLLGVGATSDDLATRIGALSAGAIVELLILVPFRFAIHSRRHNIALRMLGIVLDRVDDPKKLAPLLKDTFLAVVLGKATFQWKDGK
jgi:hypothetical protein